MSKVDVVIATYNGEKYIKSQLESIISDEYFDDFVSNIIISDDNSTDETLNIINEFNHPKIKIYTNNGKSGVCGNFQNGLKHSTSELIILSDQDDVWKPNRISVFIKGMESLGGKYKIFFSDLTVVDENLAVIHDSFWKSQGIKPVRVFSEKNMVFQNVSPGCAMILNKDLLNLSMPFPENIIMHDWWFLLLASSINASIGYTNESTILYRQHGGNVIGAKVLGFSSILKRIINGECNSYYNNIKQAQSLNVHLKENKFFNESIQTISHFDSMSTISRLNNSLQLNLTGSNVVRTIMLYLRILTIRK